MRRITAIVGTTALRPIELGHSIPIYSLVEVSESSSPRKYHLFAREDSCTMKKFANPLERPFHSNFVFTPVEEKNVEKFDDP